MSEILFSIITPTYNCKGKIEKTIKSVLSQKSSLFEYIVVDSNSNDGTLGVLKKHKSQIILLVEKDNGIYDAMNKGISLSKGKYLYFLGAGDILKGDVLRLIQKKIPKRETFFIFFNVFRKDLNHIENYKNLNKFNITGNNIIHQAILYHRNIFKLFGKYDLKYKTSADHYMNIKCFGSKHIKKLYIDLLFAIYEGNGFSTRKIDNVFFRDKSNLILKNLGIYSYLYSKFRHFLSVIVYSSKYKKSIKQLLRKFNLRL